MLVFGKREKSENPEKKVRARKGVNKLKQMTASKFVNARMSNTLT